jgi:PAS domain S-box-containing protein
MSARIKAAGEHVLMRESSYLDTFCNTGDGVFIVDANKRIIRWNKGVEKILGYSEDAALNHDCFQLVSGKITSDKVHCGPNCWTHSSALKGAPQKNFDLLTQSNSGAALWLNITVLSPIDSSEPFVTHIVRDITREKMTSLALDRFLTSIGPSGSISHKISVEEPLNQRPITHHSTPDKAAIALSGREIEVLTLLAEGLSTKGLAQKLNISHFTARNHIQNILVKLDLHSKAQAVSYAFKKGIL